MSAPARAICSSCSARNATRAVGIDISSDALRLARTNVHGAGLSHCELQRGDMYDLPFAGPLFDTVTVDRVLATAQRPAAALSEIARTLKHGGRAVVIEDFDALSAAGAANPIATLREWFARAGLECRACVRWIPKTLTCWSRSRARPAQMTCGMH